MLVLMTCTLLVAAPITAIGGIVMAIREDSGLSWILTVSIPVLVICVLTVVSGAWCRSSARCRSASTRSTACCASRSPASGSCARSCASRAEVERFGDVNADLTDTALRAGRLQAFFFPIVILVLNVSSVAVLWIGAGRIDSGEMQIGALIAFLSYLAQIIMAVMMATFMLILVPRAAVCAERIVEVLDTPSSVVRAETPVTEVHASGRLELRDVGFHYPGAEAPVLTNISMLAEPGQVTAIIGSTGSGKTTLAQPDTPPVRRHLRLRVWSTVSMCATSIPTRCGDASASCRRSRTSSPARWPATSGSPIPTQPTSSCGRRSRSPRQPTSCGRCRAACRPRLRKAAPTCRAASGSAWRSPGRWCADRRSTSSMIRSRRSTWPPTPGCAPRWRRTPPTRPSLIVAQRVSTIINADQILVLEDGECVGLGTHTELLETCDDVSRDRRVADDCGGSGMTHRHDRHTDHGPESEDRRRRRPATRFARPAASPGPMRAIGMPAEKSKDFGGSTKRLLGTDATRSASD